MRPVVESNIFYCRALRIRLTAIQLEDFPHTLLWWIFVTIRFVDYCSHNYAHYTHTVHIKTILNFILGAALHNTIIQKCYIYIVPLLTCSEKKSCLMSYGLWFENVAGLGGWVNDWRGLAAAVGCAAWQPPSPSPAPHQAGDRRQNHRLGQFNITS